MTAARPLPAELLAHPGLRLADAPARPLGAPAPAWALAEGWAEGLPDGGLPRGAVVELASPGGLGQSTSLALATCASAQAAAQARGGSVAWCAWVDASASLHAPAVRARGVDMARLLVVRPPEAAIGRVAVRLASSRVFSVIVVDLAGVPGASVHAQLARWPQLVRRLSVAVEGSDTSVVLLTELDEARSASLPVALRVELARRSPGELALRIAKERSGRVGGVRYVRPRLASASVG